MTHCSRGATLLTILGFVMAVLAQNPNSLRVDRAEGSLSGLNDEFARDPRLHDVRVEVIDGNVHLRGTVPVLEDAREATKRVEGRHLSDNLITHIVVRAPRMSDSSLRLELADKLRSLHLDSIRVRVRHGVVRVTGAFHNSNQHEIILSTICSVPGVKGLDDLMQLDEE